MSVVYWGGTRLYLKFTTVAPTIRYPTLRPDTSVVRTAVAFPRNAQHLLLAVVSVA